MGSTEMRRMETGEWRQKCENWDGEKRRKGDWRPEDGSIYD
jgi:hypothetical protein